MNGQVFLHWLSVVLFAVALNCARANDGTTSLRLIPYPKRVSLIDGRFSLRRSLVLTAPRDVAPVVGRLVGDELQRAGFDRPVVREFEDGGKTVVRLSTAEDTPVPDFAFRERATHEDYGLQVEPESVTICARGTAGLLHGASTLRQLIRANRCGPSIPCLAVDDWPSIRWRAFQDDVTRGPSTKLSELKRDIARGASLKLNIFTYYMQHQFAFSKHPIIGPQDGSLTPAELSALVKHAGPLGIHIMGNQQSFAHMQHILAHEKYAHLKEDGRTLSPAREETYELLDDLYSEVLPLLPFELFNVCCDETSGLGSKGPSKEMAEQLGPGGVYVRHIRRVRDLVCGKYGKRMLMWGDIILRHPDKLDTIPRDVIMLTWGYRPKESFEAQIAPFARSKFEFFVCPGVSNWSRVLPHFTRSVANIRTFVRDGVKHKALGVLNTSWDDDGENLNAPNWYGFAWGAECAWNGGQTPVEDFNHRVGAVLFGESGAHFGRAIELLSDARVCGLQNRTFWDTKWPSASPSARPAAVERLAIVHEAIRHLETCRQEATLDADLIDATLFGARRMALFNQRVIDRAAATEAYAAATRVELKPAVAKLEAATKAIKRTRATYMELREDWKRLWLRENKPYALDWSLQRYNNAIKRHDQLLDQLDEACRAATAGKPIPPARTLGLAS